MIDLYSVPTANGQRVHIMLEETGLPYTAHLVDLVGGQHLKSDFIKMNPFGRAPALVDHDGPKGKEITVFEGHGMLFYLAEKSGQFYPKDLAVRAEIHTWMSAISSNLSPAFAAQFWFTTIAPEPSQVALDRAISEAHRGLSAIEFHLKGREFMAGEEYTIADIHTYPIAATSASRLEAGLEKYPEIARWMDGISQRDGVARGMRVLT
ncbi:MAG: glutathione binding-like protein [Rhodospirillaceae bacterium]